MTVRKIDTLFFIKVLTIVLIINAGCQEFIFAQSVRAQRYVCRVVESFPHDVNSYTQGLFFHNGQLYESAGQYRQSSFRKVDIKKGTALQSFRFPDNYFAEGSVVLGNYLYILTWMERVVFVYDINTLKPVKQFFNPFAEGWGLTTDGKQLIMSDGSSNLYFMDPLTFVEKGRITVKLNGKKLGQLNELEYIKGEIWANVYQEDYIVIINPKNGVVRAIVDCKNLLPGSMRTQKTDVLNGIAYNPQNDQVYLTGKYWPKLFRISLTK
ncbi:MAG: glutaminyl-peptide cyclotransferase [Bacteroidales bacterium]|nr:glutaminyl-peptide cyclotransferase [Bacteroidales bacterium]